jgi:23S rRNA pseudouridine1911/1915/1917 synthase
VTDALQLTVAVDAAGRRLDQYLAEPLGSRARAAALIDAGRVQVDGRPRPKRHTVAAGEQVVVELPDPSPVDPVDQPAPFTVAYEDDHLLIVDKPAGVVVHPARGHRTGTLAQALRGRAAGGEDPARAGIVHRLDRDTSGLLVVARTEAAHRALKQLIARRALRREYLALVDGRPPARSGTIDAPIGRDRRDRMLMSLDSDDPREARTHFVTEQALPDTTLLRVTLETGRTHQIRVHLAAIGHPVTGDPQYGRPGGAGPGPGRRHGLARQFLHATRLAFDHPVSGEPVDVVSPLPEDLATALERARRG